MNLLSKSTVFVTGATGFIGSHLVERLLASGARVRALVRRPEKAGLLSEIGVEVFPGDVTDRQLVQAALEGCEWVFHLAGVMEVRLPYGVHEAVHVGGTKILAEASLQAGVKRFVYASSIAVYGLQHGENLDENSPHRFSRDAYSDTKRLAEEAVRRQVQDRGLPAVIVQPGITFGPRDETWVLGPLRRIRSGKMILPGGGKALVHPIFIDDLVDGILLAAERGRTGEAYILCGPQVFTFREYFTCLAGLAGARRIPSIPVWLASWAAAASESAARVARSTPALTRSEVRWASTSRTFSIEKARRELGYDPRIGLVAGMERVGAWLASIGKLEG